MLARPQRRQLRPAKAKLDCSGRRCGWAMSAKRRGLKRIFATLDAFIAGTYDAEQPWLGENSEIVGYMRIATTSKTAIRQRKYQNLNRHR
jgi:hypothetical protein